MRRRTFEWPQVLLYFGLHSGAQSVRGFNPSTKSSDLSFTSTATQMHSAKQEHTLSLSAKHTHTGTHTHTHLISGLTAVSARNLLIFNEDARRPLWARCRTSKRLGSNGTSKKCKQAHVSKFALTRGTSSLVDGGHDDAP